MQNPNDLNQAIQALQRETEKETHELKAKEEELQAMETGMPKVKQEIITLERTLEEKKAQLREFERKKPKLMSDIRTLKLEHQKRHSELERIQREYTEALQKSGMKVR